MNNFLNSPNFPNPPPDRRTQKQTPEDSKLLNIGLNNSNVSHKINLSNNPSLNSNPFTQKVILNPKGNFSTYSSASNNHLYTDSNEKDDYEKLRSTKTMDLLKLKHIEDMKNNILSFKVLSDKKMFLTSGSNNINVNKCNIILFGPSGSGKSSFIKTLYRALYSSPFLPPEATSKLTIKETDQNEGTICFTRLHLKEESPQTSGIVLCDTRGHIWMNDEEKEQFRVIIDGKVKEDVEIVQNKQRNALLLWEFWKKDSELFPKEIFNSQESGIDALPHNIVLVFDGSIDETFDQSDEKFYRDLVNISHIKGKFTIIFFRIQHSACYTY
jgi:predicted AAA+ superfamily ATPase